MPETFFNTSQQCSLFLRSVLLGCALSVFFDVQRALRALFPHNFAAVFLEDALFAAVCGMSYLIFAMEQGRGEVRGYFFIGGFLGFWLWHFTFGNALIALFRRIARTVYTAASKAALFIFTPVVHFFMSTCQEIKHIFVLFYSKFKRNINKSEKPLKSERQLLYNSSKPLVGSEKSNGSKSRQKKNK